MSGFSPVRNEGTSLLKEYLTWTFIAWKNPDPNKGPFISDF